MKKWNVLGVIIPSVVLMGCDGQMQALDLMTHCIKGVMYASKPSSNSSLTVLVNENFEPIKCKSKE
ncbi:hypothetical protein [Actinobacillus pleuropneumoniae]|uniref:hypothetical protein n=1 Tax=Actinobacillus pleuropneumoniae TaxID=715 RepID=UPI003F7CA374